MPNVFNNEIARVVLLKPFLIFERVMHLGKRHRSAFKPAVQYFRHTTHHGLACWIIGVRPHQVVHDRTMQVGNFHTKVALKFGNASIHVNARILGIVAAPHGNW